jgi:hypothetical protein
MAPTTGAAARAVPLAAKNAKLARTSPNCFTLKPLDQSNRMKLIAKMKVRAFIKKMKALNAEADKLSRLP